MIGLPIQSTIFEFDQANSHIRDKDKYGRTIAYVYLENGTFLNAQIIRQGYGNA
jgi:endonuclease YncB( thermonuclease family)